METILLDIPPEELYPYRYARKRLLWGLKNLENSISKEKQRRLIILKQTLENHVVVIGRKDDKISLAQNIFKATVKFQPSDFDPLSETAAASPEPQIHDLLRHRFLIFLLEVDRHGDLDLKIESKSLITDLTKQLSPESIASIVFFVDNTDAHDIEILRMKIRAISKANQDITIHPVDGSIGIVRDILHKKMTEIAETITGSLLSEKPHRTSWSKKHVQLNEMCENIKRTLAVPSKPNTFDDDMLEMFQRSRALGYSGHVFLDGRLSIYHKNDANPDAMDALKEAASKCFDVVEMCVIPDNRNVLLFTDLRHEERGTNKFEQTGTLGAIVRMQPQNQFATISVAHFASKGDKVKVHGHEIGECIWPEKSQNDSRLNDISVIQIKSIYSNQCELLHENMQMQKRQLVIDPNYPALFSEVFKGRNDVGFVTGTVTSTMAQLPFQGGLVNVCLVEGDDDVAFARRADSGAIIKLREEKENQLHGFAIIFGGAYHFPNIPEDTCIGVLLMPSIQRFQTDSNSSLLFH